MRRFYVAHKATVPDLQRTLPLFQSWRWMTYTCFLMLITRFNNFLFFGISDDRHQGFLNVETLGRKKSAPFSIIGFWTCTHPNWSFSYSTVSLHEICSKHFFWLSTITLACLQSHVIFSQKRSYYVFTNNYFVTTNEISLYWMGFTPEPLEVHFSAFITSCFKLIKK